MSERKTLALFDFDGTITKKDSFIEFIRFYKGEATFIFGMMLLSPFLIAYKLKIIKNWQAKQMTLKFFFRGETVDAFKSKCQDFATKVIPTLLKKKAIDKIEEHQQHGDRVIIVTASAEDWLEDWCKTKNIELIATRLEKVDGKITGNILGKNCYGEEKSNRILSYVRITDYSRVFAYGDSKGDDAMLKLANVKLYKPF
jgi:HAD-superfamily subfamily IB hydrolase, TIGR01490